MVRVLLGFPIGFYKNNKNLQIPHLTQAPIKRLEVKLHMILKNAMEILSQIVENYEHDFVQNSQNKDVPKLGEVFMCQYTQ